MDQTENQKEIYDIPDGNSNVINIQGLSKGFGGVQAIDGLDLSVKEGEVYGFLGRNGAGKSTTIRILMGITKASSGTIELFGKPFKGDEWELRKKIGYVAQEQNFYGWMTPETIGEFVGGFYATWDKSEYLRLIKALDLPMFRKIRTFSGGMRAKLALCLALAHRPSLLLLDEPTAGLDPVARREFIEMVRDQASHKIGTILFSSHLIDEVEVAADFIGIVEKGKMVYQGPLTDLSESVRLLRRPQNDNDVPEIPMALIDAASEIHILQDRSLKGEQILVVRNFGNPDTFDIRLSMMDNWTVEKMSLEDIFIELVRDPLRTV